MRILNTLWLVLVLVINFAGCGEDPYGIGKRIAEEPPPSHSIDVPDADFSDVTPAVDPTTPDVAPDAPTPDAVQAIDAGSMPDINPVTIDVAPDAAPDAEATDTTLPESSHLLHFFWDYPGNGGPALTPEIATMDLTVQCTDADGAFRLYEATDPIQRITPDPEALEVYRLGVQVAGVKDSWKCYALLSENEAQARLTLPPGEGTWYFDDGEPFPAPLYLIPGPFYGMWGPLSPSP